MRSIGIIGLGVIFRQHLMALAQVRDLFSLVTVCDTDSSKVSQALDLCASIAGMECVRGTDDLETFLDMAPETIVIATPPSTHSRLVCRCLDARRNVLLEKPADTNWARLGRLYERAVTQECLLHVAFHAAYAEDLRWFLRNRQSLEAQLGLHRLQRIECRFSDPYVVGGTLMEGRNSLGGSYLDSTVNELSVCSELVFLPTFHTDFFKADTLSGVHSTVVRSFLRLVDDVGLSIDCHTDWTSEVNSKQTRLFYANGASILLDHSHQRVIFGESETLFDNSRHPRLTTQYVNLYQDYSHCLDQLDSNRDQSLAIHRLLLGHFGDNDVEDDRIPV